MLGGTNQKTVDEYDFVCKILVYDYFEGMNNIKHCEPWKISYKSPRNGVGSDWYESCKIANDGDICKTNACASENKFMTSIMSFNMRKIPLSDEYRLDFGFNETDFCKEMPRKDRETSGSSSGAKIVHFFKIFLIVTLNIVFVH